MQQQQSRTDETEQSTNQQTPNFAPDRQEKVQFLQQTHDDPYRMRLEPTISISDFHDLYGDGDGPIESDTEHVLSGRISRINNFGGLTFIDLQHNENRVQTMFERDNITGYDNLIEALDLGDVIGVRGTAIREQVDELSVSVTDVDVQNKTLRHPPSEHDGVNNETRVRERAVSLRTSELHQTVQTRFHVQQAIRDFLTGNDFVEVETPILHHTTGGANATPFTTRTNAIDEDMVLRIAPELYLKRMLVGGFNNVFEMARVFRNEDIDTSHNPEFTMLELYQAYTDYEDMMDMVEQLVSTVVNETTGSMIVSHNGAEIDFTPAWERVAFDDAVAEYTPIESVNDASTAELVSVLDEHDVTVNNTSRSTVLMELYETFVEDNIVQPTIVYDYPVGSTPLCSECPDTPDRIERFEVVVNGVELANAYTELTDPQAQLDAFEQQVNVNGGTVNMQYVNDIAHGLPPCGGLGIGVDRLAMFATGSNSIKDVIPFPIVNQ